jgi:hypothetical protein
MVAMQVVIQVLMPAQAAGVAALRRYGLGVTAALWFWPPLAAGVGLERITPI